jgi:hypothetical protein
MDGFIPNNFSNPFFTPPKFFLCKLIFCRDNHFSFHPWSPHNHSPTCQSPRIRAGASNAITSASMLDGIFSVIAIIHVLFALGTETYLFFVCSLKFFPFSRTNDRQPHNTISNRFYQFHFTIHPMCPIRLAVHFTSESEFSLRFLQSKYLVNNPNIGISPTQIRRKRTVIQRHF